MHELLLFGHVTAGRHEQLLNVLAGFCAMQPRRVLQRHVLCKPARSARPVEQHVGGSQAIIQQKKPAQAQKQFDAFYQHLVQDLDEPDFGTQPGNAWTLEFHETPDPGVKSHVLRQSHYVDNTISDPQAWIEGSEFK